MWSSESREGLAICRARAVPSFLCYFKTLSIGPIPGIEPATPRSAVKRSTDCLGTTAMPNSIDGMKFDFSTAGARRLKPSRATAVLHVSSVTWFQTSCYRRAELNS